MPTGVSVSLETLLAETYPRFSVINEERLEQERILRYDPFSLDDKTRLTLIAEPFFVLDNDVQREENRNSWEKSLSGVGCLGAIGFGIATAVAFIAGSPLMGVLWLIVTMVVTWMAMRLSNLATTNFMRRSIYPRLVSCLTWLRPTADELAAILAGIDSKCARQTDGTELLSLLETAKSTIPPVRER